MFCKFSDFRRLSQLPPTVNLKTINSQAPFKIHTEDCVSLPRPSLGRPALAPLIPNVCHKKQNLKTGLGSGGKGNQKDKMAVAFTEEQLEKRVRNRFTYYLNQMADNHEDSNDCVPGDG